MKRFVILLVALLAIFTFIRDYHGPAQAAQLQDPPVVRAQITP